MKMALEAAHNADVGDQYFGQKNYNGSLMRYEDALEGKPGDVAIHVRLGRVLEKLGPLTCGGVLNVGDFVQIIH
jgi:hypothetical protein